ncbi:transglycosylase SLT domain-containing protein [Campylobacter canadensis]|uniref:transglycosylase SLT domain-containing protein n=1 Tax=Campylobacter canadensis TaxID=449520 RepID=UPI001CCE9505|nr:transglycosylase SLT domain-containing protein [Campylobacter canadensis]MBZ8002377.1 transglycosylase SLT domain-containing protein [Campylobacter canadensis]
MKKYILLFILVFNAIASDYKKDIILYSKELDTKYNIDYKIILSYIKTESNFNQYAMLLKTKDVNFVINVLKDFKIKTFKTFGDFISILPENKKSAEKIYNLIFPNIKNLKIVDYDLGLMQLNRKTIQNYKISTYKALFDFKQNMLIGADILRGCFVTFNHNSTIENVVECYNKGTNINILNKSNKKYYEKIIKNFNEISKEYL